MSKPNWACASCGMYSSRKSSVKRHIQTKHGGNASFVSFVDYLVGRNMGIYWPALPPTYLISKEERLEQENEDRLHEYHDYNKAIKRQM